jgi:hypothetical protein
VERFNAYRASGLDFADALKQALADTQYLESRTQAAPPSFVPQTRHAPPHLKADPSGYVAEAIRHLGSQGNYTPEELRQKVSALLGIEIVTQRRIAPPAPKSFAGVPQVVNTHGRGRMNGPAYGEPPTMSHGLPSQPPVGKQKRETR